MLWLGHERAFPHCQSENSNCDAAIADEQLSRAPCFVAGKVQTVPMPSIA
jgi:hypothetical protein